ncbi:DotU family type IV/VI secretion system protein [Castellaniella sp. GW247-6E4]|uniref:DotU family type IV/VI secretion system protein n=1 Tax=Castellaniella sp. GW247-6E4 TaxID=3140380 RepID=UPI0033148901
MKLLDYFIPVTAFVKAFGQASGGRTPEGLSKEIDTLVNQARMDALKDGVELPRFQEALFPVLAWADEQIARSGAWDSGHAWQHFLLQRRYFKTGLAGREFFERLEAIQASDNALREVYLLCLCLGFEGRYSIAPNASDLANIRIEQYRLLQQHDPKLAGAGHELFPEAYNQGGKTQARPRGVFGRFSMRRVLFIVLPPLILLAVGLVMHANLTHAVQQFREAVNL